MNLYAFKPDGHGSVSFFVMAENETDARCAIDKHIEDSSMIKYDHEGWNDNEYEEEYYRVSVFGPGEVAINYND